MTGPVQRAADGTHLAVLHPRRRDDVSPGIGLRDGHRGVPGQRRVVVDLPARRERTAVPVVGVLAQAQVRHQHRRA